MGLKKRQPEMPECLRRGVEVRTVMVCLLLFGAACNGGALSSLAPEQKDRVSMLLRPDSGRQGADPLLLIALPALPVEGDKLVVEIGLGSEIDILQFDTGLGESCRLDVVEEVLAAEGLDRSTHFPVCIFVAISERARIGEHTLTIELRSDGFPVLASASFQVLGAQMQSLTRGR